jgi:origin recognition complex subunit 3
VVGSGDGTPSESVQARFVQAVAELQLLGFVRSTRRKTDHVVRLTWGHI